MEIRRDTNAENIPHRRPAAGSGVALCGQNERQSDEDRFDLERLDLLMVNAPYFNENKPLRDNVPYTVTLTDGTSNVIQSPVINIVAGAMEIQRVLENAEWVAMPGDALAYAPHLRKSPPAGVPAKSVIYQFARGDRTVPNPATTALLRAGDLADRATLYRHDLAVAENPAQIRNPHPTITGIIDRNAGPMARGVQEQIAVFFASDGAEIFTRSRDASLRCRFSRRCRRTWASSREGLNIRKGRV